NEKDRIPGRIALMFLGTQRTHDGERSHRMKKATFNDAKTLSKIRRERRAASTTQTANDTRANAKAKIQRALRLLDEATRLLGDGDDLERHLAGTTSGMVETAGDAKEGTFRVWEAKSKLERALQEPNGCRCEVCGGRNDDPAGIHGRR